MDDEDLVVVWIRWGLLAAVAVLAVVLATHRGGCVEPDPWPAPTNADGQPLPSK